MTYTDSKEAIEDARQAINILIDKLVAAGHDVDATLKLRELRINGGVVNLHADETRTGPKLTDSGRTRLYIPTIRISEHYTTPSYGRRQKTKRFRQLKTGGYSWNKIISTVVEWAQLAKEAAEAQARSNTKLEQMRQLANNVLNYHGFELDLYDECHQTIDTGMLHIKASSVGIKLTVHTENESLLHALIKAFML